jgi:hypothetical protein
MRAPSELEKRTAYRLLVLTQTRAELDRHSNKLGELCLGEDTAWLN